MAEKEYLHRRYGELVDARFLGGLTTEEEDELRTIQFRLDELDEPFYRPLLRQLECIATELERGRSRMKEYYRVAWRAKETRMTGYVPGVYDRPLAEGTARTLNEGDKGELFVYWAELVPEGAMMRADGRWLQPKEDDGGKAD